jgi:hypothetical protein
MLPMRIDCARLSILNLYGLTIIWEIIKHYRYFDSQEVIDFKRTKFVCICIGTDLKYLKYLLPFALVLTSSGPFSSWRESI